ncbi:MAG TPA: sulfotransferase, partial [Gammaproteobacteria bacterium]|nr:sulfotransferase [Gammaproteobacteria bacterium]
MDSPFRMAAPILVIGMHRSGTRLLADILARLGVFMGADRQGDSESITFIRINEAIFHQCATFWTEPMPVHVLLAQPEQLERMAALVRDTLPAELAHYAGGSSWRLPDSAQQAALPFGWKDPRNTFTLPVWKRIFPSLRAIHVVRHGVDVAASLARRHHRFCVAASGGAVPSALAVFEDHSLGVLSSRRGWTLGEAFAMWEQYVEKARLESAALGERALEVRFEELLGAPHDAIPAIARFCGVDAAAADAGWLERVEPARAFAFRREPELAAFARAAPEILERY